MNTFQELTNTHILQKRSHALKTAREFFYARSYLEVDCPILSPFAALDNHIDLFTTASSPQLFLHSSPEYGMKKLLASGAPSIFQLSHVFREKESGQKHLCEFMMAEFYKLDIPYLDFIEETCDFIELFTGKKEREVYTYRQAFLHFINLDPYQDIEAITLLIQETFDFDVSDLSYDDILSVAMSGLIEPLFDENKLTIVTDFPKSQAALAEDGLDETNHPIAKRFEIYHQNLELANGYKELKCEKELKRRFDELNALRTTQSKETYPIDQPLLDAMSEYFPDCCGVAVGFDRLMMIHLNTKDIHDVIPLKGI